MPMVTKQIKVTETRLRPKPGFLPVTLTFSMPISHAHDQVRVAGAYSKVRACVLTTGK